VYIQEFLKRNNDKSFPCFNQIEKMLNLLEDLPITKEHLEDCNIGGYVADIEKNLKDCMSIQRKSKNLFEKWIRIATGLDNTFASIETENEIYTKLFLRKKKNRNWGNGIDDNHDIHEGAENEMRDGNERLDSRQLYDKMNENKKVPQKALFDFTIAPENKEIIVKEDEITYKKNLFLQAKKVGQGMSKKKDHPSRGMMEI
jgi:hypothetical protein